MDLFEERTILEKPVSLLLRFCYDPETEPPSIHKVIEGSNDRIKEFYFRFWFACEKVPLALAVTKICDGGRALVMGHAIPDFVHAVRNNGKAFAERPGKTVYPLMDFPMVVWWKAIIKAIFPKAIDGDRSTFPIASACFPARSL